MPSIISSLLREQIRLLKPIITKSSITASRALQEALGGIEAKALAEKVSFYDLNVAGREARLALPVALSPRDKRIVLYLHGGGYVAGSINYAGGFAGVLADAANMRVLCVAYRLAPEFPFPAAVEDAVGAYRYLLSWGYAPEQIALIGESAGGGLIFSLCLELKERGLPLPSCLVALSPWTDLTLGGSSYAANEKVDVSLTRAEIESFVTAYAPNDTQHPLASPLLGDLTGLPPCRIYVGGDEILMDDSVRMATRLKEAGVECELTIDEGMWHAYVLYGVPEAQQALREIWRFFWSKMEAQHG